MLSILVADENGEVVAPEVVWVAAPPVPGAAPIGRVDVAQDGTVSYIAPDAVPDPEVPLGAVEARVQLPDGELVGQKGVLITPVPLQNPTVSAFASGEVDLMTVDELVIELNSPTELSVEITPAADDDATYAWFSTVGEIEAYRSNPSAVIAEESGPGRLFAVVRDGRGGVAWRSVPIRAE